MESKLCKYCNKEFIPTQKGNKYKSIQMFCCVKCRKRYDYQHPKGPICTCKQCGKEFISKRNAVGMYCSRLCNDIARKNKSIEKQTAKQIARQSINPVCVICGKRFNGRLDRKYCSTDCFKEQARRRNKLFKQNNHQVKTIVCKECGKESNIEYGDKIKVFCSIKCMKKHGSRVSKALRRARVRGLQYERINPIEIFVRDSWHCKLCGVSTPKKLRGTIKDNAPELDHVIPLSKGGTHTKDNVQCLCRKCNSNKSDKIKIQLKLVV